MKSWTYWLKLTKENVDSVSKNSKGVYAIRKTKNIASDESDIIYIGQSGTRKQGMDKRLKSLLKDINSSREQSKYHCASQKIKKYINDGLEFSYLQSFQSPDGVEKALLLGFKCSTGKLPPCNDGF